MREYITAGGQNLIMRALAGECPIKFTRMAFGDGSISLSSPRKVTALVHPVASINVERVESDGNGQFFIKARFTNENLKTAFYMREKGIYASDGENEILFSYGNAGDDANLIPLPSEELIEQWITLDFTVQQDDEGEIIIELKSGIYVVYDDYATEQKAGLVKPDCVTIFVDEDGKIRGFSGKYKDLSEKPEILTTDEQLDSNKESGKLVDALVVKDLKKSVSDGKSSVASAITEMGVATSSDAAYSTMSDNIKKIKATLSRAANVVKALINGKNEVSLTIPKSTVTKSGIWNGATYTATIDHTEGYVDGGSESQAVTLTNQAAVTKSPSNAVQTLFTAGSRVYFAGDYKVSAVSISGSWSGATYTVNANGASASTTLTTQPAKTITPSTAAQTAIASGNRLYFSGDLKIDSLGGNAPASAVRSGYTFSSNSAGRAIQGTMKNYTIVYQQGTMFKLNAGYYLNTAYSYSKNIKGSLVSSDSKFSLAIDNGDVTVTFASGTGNLFFLMNEDIITLPAGTYVILYSVREWGDTNRKNTVKHSFKIGLVSSGAANSVAPSVGVYEGSSGFDSTVRYYTGAQFTVSGSTTYKIKGLVSITSNPNNYNCQFTFCGVTILKIT